MPNSTLAQMGFLDEDTQQEAVYDLEDTQARSDISTINGKIPSTASSSNKMATASDITDINNKIPSNASSSNKLATKSDISSAYHAAGQVTCAELVSALLVAAHEGEVYNIADNGTTTDDFVEGAGKPIRIGDNVGVVRVGLNAYKFDMLSGFIDTSGFQNKTLDTPITVDGTQKTTVETALQAINTLAAGVKSAVGTLSSLTTTVKTSIVAAINELVTSISTINGKIPSGASSSNKMATASDVTGLQNNVKANTKLIKDTVGWSGKQKIPYPYADGISKTANGVTITVNPDKSFDVKIPSSATGNTYFYVNTSGLVDGIEVGKQYKLCGHSDTSYISFVYCDKVSGDNAWGNSHESVNDILTFTPRENLTNVGLWLLVHTGATGNHTIKPVIVDGDILDTSYEPYNKDTAFPRSEQAVLGAKNWFDLNNLKPKSGATLTLSDTGFKCVVGTATTWCGVEYTRKLPLNTRFKILFDYAITSGICYVNVAVSTDGTNYTAITNTNVITSGSGSTGFEFDTANYTYLRFTFFVTNASVTTADVTFTNIMLKLATDMDDTYVPYTMTNKELTEIKNVKLTPQTGVTLSADTRLSVTGNMASLSFQATADISANSNNRLFNFATNYKPKATTYGVAIINSSVAARIYIDTYGIAWLWGTSALTEATIQGSVTWIING